MVICLFKGEFVPLVKRRFYVPCREDECLKLYELLKDNIPSIAYASFEVTPKGLVIEAYGYETDVKSLWFEVRRILSPLKEVMSKSKSLRRYDLDLIVKIIRKTFPPHVLVEVLRQKGRFVEFASGENAILSNASLEEVVEVATKLAELNLQASRVAKSTSARYYITALSALAGLSVDDVVRFSIENGLLVEEDGSYVLKVNWREALGKALKTLKLSQ